MITLSLLKYLEDNKLGKIDEDLFFEKFPADNKSGLSINSIGQANNRGVRSSQTVEIFSRGSNDVEAYKRLEDVRNLLVNAYGNTCVLPAVPPITADDYTNVSIMPPTAVSNYGQDANGRVLYSIICQIYY